MAKIIIGKSVFVYVFIGKCPRCDKEGHFMSDCPSGKEIDSKSLKSIPKPIPKPIGKYTFIARR